MYSAENHTNQPPRLSHEFMWVTQAKLRRTRAARRMRPPDLWVTAEESMLPEVAASLIMVLSELPEGGVNLCVYTQGTQYSLKYYDYIVY